jgi:hypothetical protein
VTDKLIWITTALASSPSPQSSLGLPLSYQHAYEFGSTHGGEWHDRGSSRSPWAA